jgi:integrase
MPCLKGENPHHPKEGSTLKVLPIREKKGIGRIKKLLADNPRDLCLFTLGINTAYRANELLSIKVGQVRYLETGNVLDLKQSKVNKYRMVTLNNNAISSIQEWLDSKHGSRLDDEDYLFKSERASVLSVSSVSKMVKQWCAWAGLKGQYASHTLRKTWGYWQRVERGTPIPLLMSAYGHKTQQQTLEYLCIQESEIANIYELEL